MFVCWGFFSLFFLRIYGNMLLSCLFGHGDGCAMCIAADPEKLNFISGFRVDFPDPGFEGRKFGKFTIFWWKRFFSFVDILEGHRALKNNKFRKVLYFSGPCWPSCIWIHNPGWCLFIVIDKLNGDTTPERVGTHCYVASYFPEGENSHECHSCWMNANWKGSQNSSERGLI